jgi:hypothetical protein
MKKFIVLAIGGYLWRRLRRRLEGSHGRSGGRPR